MVNILKVKIVSTSITWWGIDTASYRWKSENESRSVVSDSLWPPWNSPGQNTGVGSLSLLQGIFPTQGSNTGLPHCRRILYQLSHKGNPRILERLAYPFSSRSSWPRNQTGVSCTAGGFFTNWAIRKAHIYTYTHILSVFTFFSLTGYYRILSLVPCVI